MPQSADPGSFHPRTAALASALVAALVLVATGCSSGGQSPRAGGSTTTSTPARTGQNSSPPGSSTPEASTSDAGAAGEALQQAFVSVVAKSRPEVVEISTGTGLGSGVVYDTRGDIVTNDHVVGSSTRFQVKMVNGQTLPATLVGAYPPDDLAVIKVDGAKNLSPASFGDSGSLQVGDIVFAVGNPLGLASSVTEGIISYNGRSVSEGNGVELPQAIQTSAAINPGNSGGALVDLDGQVVGIPTLAAVNQEVGGTAAGIGFAIPSNTVKLIIPQLISSGHVTQSGRAALGITGSDATDATGRPVGVIVASVVPGGGAAQAGITPGDVISAVNGHSVGSLAELQDVLAGLSPGQKVSVEVLRQDGGTKTFVVTLGQLTG